MWLRLNGSNGQVRLKPLILNPFSLTRGFKTKTRFDICGNRLQILFFFILSKSNHILCDIQFIVGENKSYFTRSGSFEIADRIYSR